MSKFTLEQQRIIDTKSGNLVVTASAGSGKTSVMTERFLRLVTSERIPVRRILCVTFTKLAAEELKTRLKSSLTEAAMKCQDGIEREFLFRQLDDLPQAYICTVDSFCNTLVRRYFYVAGVDPQFGVIDEKVADSLMADALDETFETLYEADDENLKRALKAFCEQRSDKALKKLVLDVYRFLSSEADVDGYEKNALSLYEQENIKIAINGLIDGFLEKVKGLKPQITNLIGAAEGLKKLEGSRALLEFAAEVIGRLEADRSLENFSVIANADWTKPRITTKDEVEKQLSEEVKAVLDQLKTAIGKYKPVLLNPDGVRLGEGAGEILKSLLYVVNAFGDRYAADKVRLSLMDFADLERYALNILTSDEARAEISGSFDCVFVDEYQDTSGVQEKIFSLLERNNLFIVGDGKQSIYGFRGCDNTIFEERIKRAKPEELVRLDKNFRSSRAVIDFVNKVFSAVMTTNTFGENYADNPMIYGELYPEDYGICEIVGFSKSKSAKKIFDRGVYGVKKHLDFMREERGAGEEDKVVEIIDKVYGKEYCIVDKSGNVVKKKIGFADIAVLTRTSKDLSDRIVDTLIACGVPVASNSRRSIGEYPEIKTVSAILYTILDDGRDDYRLATALKSPVGNLTDDQLAAIRKAFKDGTFLQAVNAYRTERIDDITIKLNEFFDYIARLRLYSDFEGVGKILRRLVKDKRLDLHLLSGRFGQVRLNRLERLIAECEKEGEAFTLASYAESEESLLKNLYVNFSEGENAVKVMNVHQSKGLEFPVVIVCELGKNYYKADAGNKLIMSRKHGLGIDHYDYATKVKTPTIVKKYLEELNKKTTLSEAVRLFYVALTRAKFALYLLVDGELKAERTAGEETSACCWKDFLCSSDAVFIPDSGENEQLKPMQKTVERQVVLPPNADKKAYDRIKKYFDYRYPFAEDVNLSVKRTVTEVARKFFEGDFERTEQPTRTVFNSDAREIGTIYHSFLEKCDFFGEDAKTQLNKLVESGKMTESQRALLDDALLDRILKGRLPELVKGYDLYREQPFICLVPSQKIGEAGDGQTLIQGVIDLLAVRKDQAVIVDYKYSVKSDKALVESYGKQLELYAFAAEKVLGKKVGAVYLFNIRSNSLIPIE